MSETGEAEHTVCQIRVPLPGETGTYLKRLSEACPGALVEILSYLPVPKGKIMMNFRLSGEYSPDEALAIIRDAEDVASVDVLERSSRGMQIRVESDITRMPIVKAGEEHHLMPEFPAYIRNGYLTAVIAGTTGRMKTFLKALDSRFPGTKIIAIRHEGIDGPKGLLTDHQMEVFRAALRAGYWDVPRRASLSEIADQLQASKSTVSETLANIEKRLIEDASERYLTPD